MVSRTLGDALSELVAITKQEGSPRQACIIQGVSLEVKEIIPLAGCQDVSVMILKDPAELSVAACHAWQRVTAIDVERMRQRGKSFSFLSYAALPRSPNITGEHGFSLSTYDPEAVRLQTQEVKFLYENRIHLLKESDSSERLERGGLLIDQDQKIVGMALLDSTVVWTDTLEKLLGNL